jgi:hypothetical protein
MFSSLSGVDINIDVCVCGLQEALLKQRVSEHKKKGDRDNVTKSACTRSHKTKRKINFVNKWS